MSLTLYRKYRPQRFSDVVGQQHIKTTLLAELEADRVVHAYLFVGPRGVGKTTVARLLAKALNCTGRKHGEPDNSCVSCSTINSGQSLDLIEIDAASHTQVDHVRENILPAARTAPAVGRRKIFIIDEVHMLSTSAFNALLKMLEEPPAHVVFILATTEAHRLPATIISRCQRFDFRRVAVEDTVNRLAHLSSQEGVRCDRAVLERIAHLSQGSLRDAESMLGQTIGLGEKHITSDLADLVLPRSDTQSVLSCLEAIVRGRPAEGLDLVQRLVDDGIHVATFMRECVDVIRLAMLASSGVQNALNFFDRDDEVRVRDLVAKTSTAQLVTMLDVMMRRERDERVTSLPQLPLELAIVELSAVNGDLPAPTQPARPLPAKKKSATGTGGRQPIGDEWAKTLERLRGSSPSVAVLLKTVVPHGIVDDVVELGCPFEFHRERILDRKNRQLIESALSEIFGRPVTIQISVAENGPGSNPQPKSQSQVSGDVWSEALKAFGGDIVSDDSPSR